MRRPLGLRVLMALTGVVLLFVYGFIAFFLYRGALFLWARRPDPVTTAIVVVVLTLVFGYASYKFGTAQILRELDASEIPRGRAPELHRTVADLADRMDIETPTLHVSRMGMPNALALGTPSEGNVVLDETLFRLLSGRELRAIIAHELAHIESRDGLVQTLGFSLIRTVTGLLFLVVFPIALVAGGFARALAFIRGDPPVKIREHVARARLAIAQLVVLVMLALTILLRAHSRRREFAADDRAAELTDPLELARALAKIKRASESRWGLLSPLYVSGDEEGLLTRLLATHPDMEERVERLRERADERGRARHITVE